jgi:hypothetical protein
MMAKRRREKKNLYSQAKPIGFGVILLVAVVAIVSSFHPKIKSMPTAAQNILWPEDAPLIELVVRNKTNQRIEARHNNKTIAHINPSRQITTPMFDCDSQVDQDCQDWQVSELYKFIASGNRHISLSPSLFVSGENLILSHPCYINLRSASLEGGQEVEPEKEYRLIFTIQGNKFEESFVALEELPSIGTGN